MTLHNAIKKFVRPGTTIVSDGWKGYNGLDQLQGFDYTHDVVNHSKHYKDPVTGKHTNTIEGKWNKLKYEIPKQGYRSDEVLQDYLAEQMWRRQNDGHLWEAAIMALKSYVQRF